METIWKYEVRHTEKQNISMPKEAKILTIQPQHSWIQMWVQVNTSNEKEDRTFLIFGTGWDMTGYNDLKYIGTYQVAGGNGVFHLYEQLK